MSKKPVAAFQHLTSLAKDLNEISDQLTKELSEVEESLNHLRLGVPVWVVAASYEVEGASPGEHLTQVETLGYARHKGKWGLVVGSYIDEIEDYPESLMFVKDASRETRINALAAIPKLVEALASEAKRVTEDLRTKLDAARTIKAGLRAKVFTPEK